MKKTLLICLAASAMVSCSQDEVMEVAQKEAISFKDAFVENATRAIDGTYSNENLPAAFKVYGNTQGDETGAPIVPIFNAVEVSKTNTTGVGVSYKYNANYTQYWIDNNTYNFAAVVDANTTNIGTDGLPTTIEYDASNQKDLLYAEELNKKKTNYTNGEVKFTFNHLLSKAMFTVVNEMADNDANKIYFYRVSDVQINNAYKTATYHAVASGEGENAIAKGTWMPTAGDANTIMVDFGHVCNNATADNTAAYEIPMNSSATSNNQRVLIPAAYSSSTKQLNITCTIETLIQQTDENGAVTYATINTENYNKSIDQTFEAGKAYNFNITLGNPGDVIKFGVEAIEEWDDNHTNYDKEIYK